MAQNYKNKNVLKNPPFYSEEIKSVMKKNKKISNIEFLSELPFFDKKPKELTNIQVSKELPFIHQKEKKDQKD